MLKSNYLTGIKCFHGRLLVLPNSTLISDSRHVIPHGTIKHTMSLSASGPRSAELF